MSKTLITEMKETLPVSLNFDETTNLPLFSEKKKIIALLKAYLPLPHNIAEYGCGKKCSLILKKLVDFGIPAFSLQRGLIMEKSLSEKDLDQTDFNQRKHALVIENPLFYRADIGEKSLQEMLENKGFSIDTEKTTIQCGKYSLAHQKLLQFVHARSHVFPIVTFRDDQHGNTVELVVDPTILQRTLFKPQLLRKLLNAHEAYILKAPLLGHFRLAQEYLTDTQKREINQLIGDSTFATLPLKEEHELFQKLIQGGSKIINTPSKRTYANNYMNGNELTYHQQKEETGYGDPFRDLFKACIEARKNKSENVILLKKRLKDLEETIHLASVISRDARYAKKELEPLAILDATVSYHNSLKKLISLTKENTLADLLHDDEIVEQLQGVGISLKNKIERIAYVSTSELGEIDARALNEEFMQASLEAIEQMNNAGLTVFIDSVGNIHGILLTNQQKEQVASGKISLPEITNRAICHCSHIDTVKDAGKYDGRLGVISGIQIANILTKLRTHFNYNIYRGEKNHLLVSSFIGEEMTFTGQNVAMPGSAAVCGHVSPSDVYKMKNISGEVFKEKLIELLQVIQQNQKSNSIEIFNDFTSCKDDKEILDACFSPTDFFSPFTYERHIEQGPQLDREGTPLIPVSGIMGIHQEDITFTGNKAEEAALKCNTLLRELVLKKERAARITVGKTQTDTSTKQSSSSSFTLLCSCTGEKNHAGATLIEDRKDAGVALGKAFLYFQELVEHISQQYKIKLTASVGNITLLPGTNRNVIPEEASASFSVIGDLSTPAKQEIFEKLYAYFIGTLSLPVSDGGEGITGYMVEESNFTTSYTTTSLSIDLRTPSENSKRKCLQEISTILKNLCKEYNVSIERSIEQNVASLTLKDSGQLLQLERSYGGSHNPNEAELLTDITRGSLLQLATTINFLETKNVNGYNLFNIVSLLLPESRVSKKEFISGALHDTCNIAKKVQSNS